MPKRLDRTDREINAAVLAIRNTVNNSRRHLHLKAKTYAGIPTIHTCGIRLNIECHACLGLNR